MKFKNLTEKFTVGLIGIIVFLLLLEISLRFIGIISSRRPDNQLAGNGYNNTYTILCLGDSFTFGAGAPPGMDYPSQLEAMLNSRAKNKKFKVINRGMSSYNTTQILNVLKDTLARGIKPDLVTFLGGGANYWNYWGYNTYLKGRTPSAVINDYLYRIRTYKLARLLYLNLKEKIDMKLFMEQINSYLLKEDLSKRINYYDKGKFYKEQCKYDEAIKWLKKGIEIDPNCDIYYYGMAVNYSHKKDYEKAIFYIKKAIRLNPRSNDYYSKLFNIYQRQGGYNDILDFLNELAKDSLIPEGFIDMLKKINNKEDIPQEIKRWMLIDIEKIIKMCKENSIKIILLGYPRNPEMNDLFNNIAKDNSVPFVNNYQVFCRLRQAGESMKDYFVLDGHCNTKGYEVMARNLFDKMIEEKIVSFNE